MNLSGLNFQALRNANTVRCEQVFHPVKDWSALEWAGAMCGEAGEAANLAKKIKRFETNTNTAKDPATIEECRSLLAGEIADVIIYADLLAAREGIELGPCVREKFNEVSRRMGSTVFLQDPYDYWFEELQRIARLCGWSEKAIQSMDKEAFREAYLDHETPATAFLEEVQAGL